jgi:hypothetical protein
LIISAAVIVLLAAWPARAEEPRPLVRDCQVGYLLNYNFLSPRPYCWPGKEAPLSGWEVDKSGGSWACHPTCHFPDGFAFHSDWFKLVDTSPTAAVSIRHQIARQSEGKLTLEFRFKLPVRMDGASWQLRDLKRAGFALVTAGKNLCYEAADGTPVVLQPYEAGRAYGVKVIADLTAKSAEVLIDGVRKAQAAAFCRPIETIDYVLVKTGEAAVGEMVIGPVNVYKGYLVNETFVTSNPGPPPADWSVDSCVARIEEFPCGSGPDVFSLKLSGQQGRVAAASKTFTPLGDKTVFECRILLPSKQDGARVELADERGRSGLSLVTAGGNLCFLDGQQAAVPLVSNYRANLWYMIKAVADPRTGVAEICVNGKPAARHAAFSGDRKPFARVRFVSPATMWVDDVIVYPWRDYPADYVPPPKPCPAKNGYLLGVQSCNLWREGNSYAGWDYVYPYRNRRQPLLGWYDEGHPEETDWEIKWQVEHGIGFEMHCWYRPNNAINHPIKDGVLDQGIIRGLFNARYGGLAKFAIMCVDEGACETNPDDFRQNILPYWIEYFFKDPRYMKIDGRPIVSIYHVGNWLRMFRGVEGGRKAIATLRQQCRKAGFSGVIVLMEHRGAERETMRAMKAMGIDYCYAYTWGTPDVNAQRRNNLAQRDAAAAAGFSILPSISMGWQTAAWGVDAGGWVPRAEYQALAEWARDQLMPSLLPTSLGRRIVMLANWNEFGEGHFMLPTRGAGFRYLDVLRSVFCGDAPHEDAVPTDAQKRRFTLLYPRD